MSEAVDAPREAWCAWHLNMLCDEAIKAYHSHSTYRNRNTNSNTNSKTNSNSRDNGNGNVNTDRRQRQRGFFINYDRFVSLSLIQYKPDPIQYYSLTNANMRRQLIKF